MRLFTGQIGQKLQRNRYDNENINFAMYRENGFAVNRANHDINAPALGRYKIAKTKPSIYKDHT